MEKYGNGVLFLFASLTLGLAPFFPEPHIWANLRWILGGAHGMELTNWLDTAMHGTPWVLLLGWSGKQAYLWVKGKTGSPAVTPSNSKPVG